MLPSDEAAQLVIEGKADLTITPDDFALPDQPSELLCEERQCVIGWSGNPVFESGVSVAAFDLAGHVAVHVGSNRVPSFADRQIDRMGRKRRVEVTCGCFTMVPWLLVETPRLAVMHERLARQMVERFPLSIAPIPFPFPLMREMIQYHRAREDDAGLRWLRGELKAEAATNEP
jgi:DNA-binding transcriptional LysR family regulator